MRDDRDPDLLAAVEREIARLPLPTRERSRRTRRPRGGMRMLAAIVTVVIVLGLAAGAGRWISSYRATVAASATPAVVSGTPSGASPACPAPPAPEHLPWSASGAPSESHDGLTTTVRYEGPSGWYVTVSRGSGLRPPTISNAPLPITLLAGREVTFVWIGDPGVGEVDAWWQEGAAPCDSVQVRLLLRGSFYSDAIITEFGNVIWSLPAIPVPADGGLTGNIATIALPSAPAHLDVNLQTHRLYVTDRTGSLTMVDTRTNAVLRTVALPLAEPTGVAAAVAVLPALDRVYLTDSAADRLIVLDGTSLQLVATIPVGRAPIALATDAKANRVFVANLGFYPNNLDQVLLAGSVSIVDGAANRVLANVPTRGNPVTIGFLARANAPGRIYAAGNELSPSTNGFVQVIDQVNAGTFTEATTIGVAAGPQSLVTDGQRNLVYVVHPGQRPQPSALTIIDAAAPPAIAAQTFQQPAVNMVAIGINAEANPSFHRLYVIGGSAYGGTIQIYRNTGPLPAQERELRVGMNPVALAVDSSAKRIYVANAGSNSISVIQQGAR